MKRIDLLQNSFGDDRRVGAFALGERDGNRGIFRAGRLACTTASVRKHHIAVRLGGAVFQLLHHIAQVDRAARVDSDYHLLQVLGPGEEPSRLDLELPIVAGETSRLSCGCSRSGVDSRLPLA